MKVVADRYGGVTVVSSTIPDNKEIFIKQLNSLLKENLKSRLIWINIPINRSEYIEVLTKKDFNFHHCSEKEIMLVKKSCRDVEVPTRINYTLGVGAVVIDCNKILVVKDKFSKGYKLPGGHVDQNERIKDAVVREVFEETGVKIEFDSIINLGHFIDSYFNASSIYLVCIATPINKDIKVRDRGEILEAKWIPVDNFLSSNHVNSFNKSIVETVYNSREVELREREIGLNIEGEVFY